MHQNPLPLTDTDRNPASRELSTPARIRRAVLKAYLESSGEAISNPELYSRAMDLAQVDEAQRRRRTPVGQSGGMHSLPARTARWAQQSLKKAGLIEKADGRGLWRLTTNAKLTLRRVNRGCGLVAFSSRLGAALWCDAREAFLGLDEPIHLVVTSPPYALASSRAYDSPRPDEWVDFICLAIEPLVPKLAVGASLALNIGSDCFLPNSPARRMLPERLMIALHDRFGFQKMDTLIWHAPNKAPGPMQWASKTRQQLHVGYEPILWVCKDPKEVRSCNQRVLQPHRPAHLRFVERGGETAERLVSDGAYRRTVGAFSNPTAGSIPRNVITQGTTCHSQRQYKAAARAMGLPAHGAPFPLKLAQFLIQFLSDKGDLVVDPFGGSMTTGLAAESLGRRWLCSEIMAEHCRSSATRFQDVWVNPFLDTLLGFEDADRKVQLAFAL